MKSSELIETICAYIEEQLELPFALYTDALPTEAGDGACIRCDPAAAASREYTDGSRLVTWNLSVYVRCAAAEDAREWAKAIPDALDGAEITSEDDVVIACEAETLPQYIETDAKGAVIYMASFIAGYLQETNAS